jgi:hypothetical protein
MTSEGRCPHYKVILNWDGDDALSHTEAGMSAATFKVCRFPSFQSRINSSACQHAYAPGPQS